MFDDPRARRAWRLFRLRTELMLGGVSGGVRRQILEDLSAHVRDIVADGDPAVAEHQRVAEALERVGDPREFIAPLLADAILNGPRPETGLGARCRAVLSSAALGGRRLASAMTVLVSAFVGASLAIMAAGSLIFPRSVGVFMLSEDTVQIRLFGLSDQTGTPLWAPWLALALGAFGCGLLWLAWRRARRIVSEILAIG